VSGKISRRKALALGGGVAVGAAVGASVGTGSAAAAGEWIRLPVVTANIGRTNLGAREAAIRDVRNADGDNRPVVGWQEINEGDTGEPAMIDQHFGPMYANAFLRNDESYRVPISVPRPWHVVDSKPTRVHGGIEGKTPPRWINEVVCAHESDSRLKFVLVNTHYIANAFNGGMNPDLQDEWLAMKAAHKERVLAQHQNQGRLVIWTADTNRENYDTATGWQAERKAFFNGVDRLNWLPGNGDVQLELLNTKIIDMNVDHHEARLAIFRIRLAI
jgi:hypothetical protein